MSYFCIKYIKIVFLKNDAFSQFLFQKYFFYSRIKFINCNLTLLIYKTRSKYFFCVCVIEVIK